MKTIKQISGDILLYFYYLQRDDYSYLHDFTLSFQMRHFSNGEKSPVMGKKDNDICKNLLKISEKDNDIYNALMYLYEKSFIELSNSKSNVNDHFHNFKVSAYGIDIVEGIERGEEEKKNFNVNFNIKVKNNFNVESLLKAELGSILKLGLI